MECHVEHEDVSDETPVAGAQVSAVEADSVEAPLPRGRQIESLLAVRREMARVYWAVKHSKMDLDKGKGLVHMLGQISAVMKAEQGNDEELLRRLADLERRLGIGKQHGTH